MNENLNKFKCFLFIFVLTFAIPRVGNAHFVIGTDHGLNLGYDLRTFIISIGGGFFYQNGESKSMTNYDETDTTEYTLFSISPSIKAKIFFKRRSLSPYVSGEIAKNVQIIVSAKGYDDNESVERDMRDNGVNFLFRTGLGFEYSLKDILKRKISVGGEIGVSGQVSNHRSEYPGPTYESHGFYLSDYIRFPTIFYYF
jgi:hypothetical protein